MSASSLSRDAAPRPAAPPGALQRLPGPRLSQWRDSGRNSTMQRRIDGAKGGVGFVLNAGSYDADPGRGSYSDHPDPRPPFGAAGTGSAAAPAPPLEQQQQQQQQQQQRRNPIFANSLGWSRAQQGYSGRPDGDGAIADPLLDDGGGSPRPEQVAADPRTGAGAIAACDIFRDDAARSSVRSSVDALPARRFGESATPLNTDLLSGKVSVRGRLGAARWPADFGSELGDGWPLRFSRQNAPFGPAFATAARGERYEDTGALVRECVELVGATPASASRVEFGAHGGQPLPGAYAMVPDREAARAKEEAEAEAAAGRLAYSQARQERGRAITAAAARSANASFLRDSQARSKSRQARASRRARRSRSGAGAGAAPAPTAAAAAAGGGGGSAPGAPGEWVEPRATWDSTAKSLLPAGEFVPSDYSQIEPPAMVAESANRFDALWATRMDESVYWPVLPDGTAAAAAAAIMKRRRQRRGSSSSGGTLVGGEGRRTGVGKLAAAGSAAQRL